MDAQELVALIQAQIAPGRNTTAAAVVHAGKLAKAEEVKEYWQSIAPHWGDRDPRGATDPSETADGKIVNLRPDAYSDSLRIVEKRDGGVRVGSPEFVAVLIEYGSAKNPEFACAARTVAHFNGEVTERSVNRKGQLTRPKSRGSVEAFE